MKLYRYKPINFAFGILCYDSNAAALKSTCSSISRNYPKIPYIGIVPNFSHKEEVKTMKNFCEIHIGGNSITSLINVAMKNAPMEWMFMIMAGSFVRSNLDKKFSYFIESEKDILFPIADRKMTFMDGTINGLLWHRDTFSEVGDLETQNSLELCKAIWCLNAIDKGCKFKAVQGSKIC